MKKVKFILKNAYEYMLWTGVIIGIALVITGLVKADLDLARDGVVFQILFLLQIQVNDIIEIINKASKSKSDISPFRGEGMTLEKKAKLKEILEKYHTETQLGLTPEKKAILKSLAGTCNTPICFSDIVNDEE